MSFKMMNGVEVYDKQDVDGIVETINTTSAQHTTDIQQLNQNKAEKTYAQETRQIANDAKNAIGDDDQHGLRGRIKAVENAIGSNNNTSSIEGRLDYLETHSVTVEDLSQQLTGKADKNYTQQTRQIANNNSSSISALENRTTALENNKANTSALNNTNDRVTALENSTASASDLSDTNDRVTALENNKANASDLSDTNSRVTTLENNKANKSEIPSMVSSAIDNVINTKVAEITSDINHIVDNAIDDALEDYDTPAQTTQKTATAINTALQSYDDSNAVNSKIDAAVATRPVAMSTAEATAIVNQYF